MLFAKARQYPNYNPLRKLVINVYAKDPIELRKLSVNSTITSIYYQTESWLAGRLSEDESYKVPDFAIPTDFTASIKF